MPERSALMTAASPSPDSIKDLRTGVWYGDAPFDLHIPAEWRVTVFWPDTPPPLSDVEIVEALERPVGQPPIRELCHGKSRPLVIVDDTNRPTPVARVLPFLLAQFREAGIQPSAVRILLATGTHGAPRLASMVQKLGPVAANCRAIVHDQDSHLVDIGSTAHGTPVLVNREVAISDFVVGIGGVYPNHMAGFGGGSKLALGVLGFRSIERLHFGHWRKGWGTSAGENTFRKDLDEIARMIKFRTGICLHVDADREAVRIATGDHFQYYPAEVAFARRTFSARPPDSYADVVIANAYPEDLSLTSVCKKALTPLQLCPPGVSRIVLASCPEGVGHHGLFPILDRRRTSLARRAIHLASNPRKFAGALGSRLRQSHDSSAPRRPIWLYRPAFFWEDLPPRVGEVQVASSWPDILEAVRREHPGKKHLNVFLYPCSPLQTFVPPETDELPVR